MNRKIFTLLLVVSVLLLASAGATAQPPAPLAPQALLGTGFTFQGQLKNAAGPVSGTCDMQFSLWDAAGSGAPPTGGAQVGLREDQAVAVTDGLFTVVLNRAGRFGGNAFTGEARWLQVAVTCPGDSGFTTLSPRQALTATPYALSLMPNATVNGLNDTGALSFGSTTRQMLNLWGTQYGIGVQSYDMYFRTDNGAGFAWYSGGTHSDGHYDSGFLGSTLMTLDSSNGLTVGSKVSANINSASPGAAVLATNQGNGYGAYGQSTSGIGVIGEGGTHGVAGISSSTNHSGIYGVNTSQGGDGVRGESAGCIFPEGCFAGAGVHGVNSSIGAGVLGEGNSFGLYGYAASSSGYGIYGYNPNCGAGGSCYGVYSNGNLAVAPGYTKSAIVQTADYGDRQLYSVESPENWFEDFGLGQLTNGRATVQIDPLFAQTVNLNEDYHVFLTPRDGFADLYVTQLTPTSFEVRDAQGTANLAFSYRIIARRAGFEGIRLAPAGPSPTATALEPAQRLNR